MAAHMFSVILKTPGTPQRVTDTTVPAQAAITGVLAGTVSPEGSFIQFSSERGNTAGMRIFIGGAAMSVAAKTGIMIELMPGDTQTIPLGGDTSDASEFWFDTNSPNANTEKLLVAVI